MAKILLYWGWPDADLVECPDFIADNLPKYQIEFDNWISNPSSQHQYWSKDSEGNVGLCYNGDAFIDWLNKFILQDNTENAYFIKREYRPSDEEMKLPRINF